MCATIRASVVFPDPGGPNRISDGTRSSWIALPQRPPGADDLLLPDEVVERRRPQPLRERRGRVETAARGLAEEVAHDREVC